MENLKIRVNGEAESKEAQELFFELGYEKRSVARYYPSWISNFHECNGRDLKYTSEPADHWLIKCKEINLPELRDLVVLKRNDVGDATHEGSITDNVYYISSDEEVYRFESSAWCFSTVIVADLKPIEKKEMKEYLMPSEDYKLIKACRKEGNDWIEIPEGAVKAHLNNSKTINFVNADDDYMNIATNGEWIDTHRGKHEACGHELIWQRHTHPEELPFIDDESSLSNSKIGRRAITVKIPVESLNDQYAEIEKVRQSAWQKQEGGSHYKNLKIQPMQYALENKLDYAQANVVKYVTRHKEKNGKEDLLKAIHNIELMIEFYYGDEK